MRWIWAVTAARPFAEKLVCRSGRREDSPPTVSIKPIFCESPVSRLVQHGTFACNASRCTSCSCAVNRGSHLVAVERPQLSACGRFQTMELVGKCASNLVRREIWLTVASPSAAENAVGGILDHLSSNIYGFTRAGHAPDGGPGSGARGMAIALPDARTGAGRSSGAKLPGEVSVRQDIHGLRARTRSHGH